MASTGILGSSLVKKYWMALTGLFLCVFLVVHLAGNLTLLDVSSEGQLRFNAYSEFMTTFPVIKVVSYLLYFSILFHAFDGLYLAYQNRQARPIRYVKENRAANRSWASNNMALLGTIILVFIVIHMRSFWYEMHWGDIGMDSAGNKDLWSVTVAAFQSPLYTGFYVLCMVVLAYHLLHGFQSAFQSLGINHRRYNPIIKGVGLFFGVVIPVLFALLPVWLYFNA
jgi:succinate dehydrogenase / fumarate reductase, cytochrome b subunit